MENSIKTISTINPSVTESKERSMVEACAPVIDLKVGVLLSHGVSLCSTSNPLGSIPIKRNTVRSTLASTALTQVLD